MHWDRRPYVCYYVEDYQTVVPHENVETTFEHRMIKHTYMIREEKGWDSDLARFFLFSPTSQTMHGDI